MSDDSTATGFRATAEPRTCGCGAVYQPRRRDQWRCGECRSRNRGGRTRPSRAQDSDRRTRQRAKQEQNVIDGIAAKRYIGVDGEGLTEWSNWYDEHWEEGDEVYLDHRYKFAAMAQDGPDGTTQLPDLEPEPGAKRITTTQMLWYLWKNTAKTPEEREAKTPAPSIWFYGSKYDWTHILRDIAIQDPEFLNSVFHPPVNDPFKTYWWHGWGISYIQASVKISRVVGRDDKGKLIIASRFFQDGFKCWGGGSFVSQLKSWKVGTPAVWERIEGMKDKRGHFTEIDDQVREYCREEVRLLAQLARKITLLASEMDIRPKAGHVYSAGSYAKAMLRHHRIPADPKTEWDGYRGPDRYAGGDARVQDVLMRAFFGGWFDLFETGIFEELHSIDLASAYPHVIRDLPCLSHGGWIDGRSDHPKALTFGRVSWEPSDPEQDQKVGPFPWRFPNGRTYRPLIGEGWYVGELIDAAHRLGTYDITEHEWISFVPECDHEPFNWVQDVYDLRVSLGKDGRGLVLKVSLNSIYGTFADTLSMDSRYASIAWAATITGRTQARLLEVIADNLEDVVGVATDGIVSKRPIVTTERPPAKILGGWDYEGTMNDVLFIQPGLYLAGSGEEPKKTTRTRGHGLRDMRELEPRLREAWERDGWKGEVTYSRERLIPAKLALTRKTPLEVYGQWVDTPVTVKFKPSSRIPIDQPGPVKTSVVSMWHLLDPKINGTERELSAPYDRLLNMELNRALIEAMELDDGQPA